MSSPSNEYIKSKTDKDLMEFVSMVTLYTNLPSMKTFCPYKKQNTGIDITKDTILTDSITDGWSL